MRRDWIVKALFCVSLAWTLTPSQAVANDYVRPDTNNWYRYVDLQTGEERLSKVEASQGNWKLWTNFMGLEDPTWVYTADSTDRFWIWNGSDYQYVGNPSDSVGSRANVDWPPCNSGQVELSAKGSISLKAGNFTDVVELSLDGSCREGVRRVWFAKEVGIVGWVEETRNGYAVFELAAANVDGTQYPKNNSQPNPSSDRPVAPSEHDDMETILWGANDTYLVVDTYADAFRGLQNSGVTSTVIVDSNSVASELQYEMAQQNVSLSNVDFLVVAIDSVWMRDYGPIVLKRPNGDRVVADLDYYYSRPQDNAFPSAYANYRGWDYVKVNLGYEGGNFATDGRGVAFSSTGVQEFNPGMSQRRIDEEFAKLGCDTIDWFEPLIDEGTTHIDMFARIMNDDTALVSQYPSSHRQRRVVDDAAAIFRARGYNVIRVYTSHNYDEFATYSNSVLANGVALIPQYGNSSRDSAALKAYRDLGYTAVGIDSRLIIKYSGATHCLSMQVPAGR